MRRPRRLTPIREGENDLTKLIFLWKKPVQFHEMERAAAAVKFDALWSSSAAEAKNKQPLLAGPSVGGSAPPCIIVPLLFVLAHFVRVHVHMWPRGAGEIPIAGSRGQKAAGVDAATLRRLIP